jgi:hypothetical protein
MKIYYVITSKGNFGCINQDKLSKLHPGSKQFFCDISVFKGHLYGSEWNG